MAHVLAAGRFPKETDTVSVLIYKAHPTRFDTKF